MKIYLLIPILLLSSFSFAEDRYGKNPQDDYYYQQERAEKAKQRDQEWVRQQEDAERDRRIRRLEDGNRESFLDSIMNRK